MPESSVVSRTVGLLVAIAVALTVLWVLTVVLDWLSGPVTSILFAVLVVAVLVLLVGSRL